MPVRLACRLLLQIGLLVAHAVLCAAQDAPAKPAGAPIRSQAADKADFETVCGACHSTTMVSDFLSAPEWEQTIQQMVSLGAKATDEQLEAVLRFLLRNFTKVNVNTANAGDLPLVLDISDAAAQALVKYRAAHGNFQTLDDLKKVPGIDPEKLAARKDRIVF